MICQTISMLHALTLAVLTLSGVVEYWHILILAAVIGISDSFEVPARQGFTIRLVEDEKDLGNGIALTSTLFNVTRLVGPSIAGMVIAVVGEGICFLMNGMAYSATLTALFLMRFRKPLVTDQVRKSVLEGMKEGVRYVASFLPLRNYLGAIALVSFFAFPYMVLLPVFAREILGGGPRTLGFLMGATGLGALAGSVRLALRKSPWVSAGSWRCPASSSGSPWRPSPSRGCSLFPWSSWPASDSSWSLPWSPATPWSRPWWTRTSGTG